MMFESMEKIMSAGLGAISMTREKAEEIFDEYVKRGEAARENKEGFVSEVMDYAEKNRQELESMIGRQLGKSLANLNLPSKEDFDRLEKKIDQLQRKKEQK